MIYTTNELIKKGETEYSIRNRIKNKSLFLIERGVYSDEPNPYFDEIYICKKYPDSILSGISALAIYDLIDFIPDKFYLVTEQHSFPIRRKDVYQSYQDPSFFKVGKTKIKYKGGLINIYDKERLLIETIRLKEKIAPEIYYEAIESFRRIKNELDFYKINKYVKVFKNRGGLLQKIKEII